MSVLGEEEEELEWGEGAWRKGRSIVEETSVEGRRNSLLRWKGMRGKEGGDPEAR